MDKNKIYKLARGLYYKNPMLLLWGSIYKKLLFNKSSRADNITKQIAKQPPNDILQKRSKRIL